MLGRHTPAHGRTIAAGAVLIACLAIMALSASEAKRARTAAPAVGTTILGAAWKADNTPIPHARLRLRNVTTGRAEAIATANASGQFTFSNMEPGSYVIELVNDDGKVLALGQVFSLGPGETVATFVRLSARNSLFGGFFTNAAASAVTAASSLGVTSLGSDGQPVSAAPGNGQ
jgi:hypothetical protein